LLIAKRLALHGTLADWVLLRQNARIIAVIVALTIGATESFGGRIFLYLMTNGPGTAAADCSRPT